MIADEYSNQIIQEKLQSLALKTDTLYYFIITADSDSLQEAAERLFITQQALSRQIKQLEHTLGFKLIQRNQKKEQRLTPAGQLLRTECHALFTRLYHLENLFLTPEQGLPNTAFRLGSLLLLDSHVSSVMDEWQAKDPSFYPLIDMPGESASSLELKLMNGDLDMGLLLAPPLQPELTYIALPKSPYAIIGAPEVRGTWQELSYFTFVTHQHSQEDHFNVWPEKQWPRKIIGKADFAMALELAACGHICLHMPKQILDGFAYQDRLVEVTPAPFENHYTPYLVWKPPLSPVAEAIKTEILRRIYATQTPD
jgi:DNA-binding transcriptional LysR family regulator